MTIFDEFYHKLDAAAVSAMQVPQFKRALQTSAAARPRPACGIRQTGLFINA
jgi:hypothetical protein